MTVIDVARHARRARHAGQSVQSLKDRILTLTAANARVRADNSELIAANEVLESEARWVLIRSCSDSIRVAQLTQERDRAVAEVKRLQRKVIDAGVEHQRLRTAVTLARPRIYAVDTQLVRPFSPSYELPFVSPVPYRDTSSDTTQELPLLDRPA
ncbi:hypothetical protein [Streptomyces sp. CBMA152]|uniref:hypothetical protein n=1 Tax=Streptomyces sp. CBMA152 TaxID=1896312 RepID=UPI00166068A1|nr:hypothetical protein [Streptomyces sp. CBMA152]MBD0743499.1 hypothetical protein [Streptomyces sp. CBMA152]